MNNLLYRGVSVEDDKLNNGRISPKGKNPDCCVKYGQQGVQFGAGYVFGSSEGNAVRSHQVETGLNDTCYISTTTDKNVARRFATSGGFGNGYIYTLDKNLFEEFGVVSYKLSNHESTSEYEVSIRESGNGDIPMGVVVSKEFVKIT